MKNKTRIAFLSLALLLSAPPFIMANDQDQAQEMAIMQAAIRAELQQQVGDFFNFLSNPNNSDEEIHVFTEQIIDRSANTAAPSSQEEIINSARQIHAIIHMLELQDKSPVIMRNLNRIAKISANDQLKALVAYLEQNNIDLSDINAFA